VSPSSLPPHMPSLAILKATASLSDVARILDFQPKALSFILYKLPAAAKYTTFQVPKRSGGQRTIQAPVDRLKILQHKLSDLLQDCVDEINTTRRLKDRAAHGFKRNRSIITNARQHLHRRWVLNIDLEDFFPSINFGRVRGFLINNRDFALKPNVATIIAQIACNENALPQGSPCSPVLSNLIAHLLDMHLVKLASNAGCTYSRYADDLTFSTNKKEFPPEIAISVGDDGPEPHLWLLGDALHAAVTRSGFSINPKKTHCMYRTSRQEVTGLVVNEKVNVRGEYRQNVRAMVNKLVTTGKFEIYSAVQKDGNVTMEKRPGTPSQLHGMLGFIDGIDFYNRTLTKDKLAAAPSSRERVYREFLMYTMFYAAQMPVIVCEGATDTVYLTHAIRSLAGEFSDLVEMKGKKLHLKVRIYKYSESSTARLLGLKEGGSGGVAKFLVAYKKETRRFGPGLSQPVIIVYDNDEGRKSVLNVMKDTFKIQATGSAPFTHVFKNMYVVPTPLGSNSKESKIEDFFDEATRATLIEGKIFNPDNKLDKDKEYSKQVFAHRVVRPNADTIDFSGFKPLLANLVAVIREHRSPVMDPSTSSTP